MIRRSLPARGARQRGFSLIEVIAAFLLFALGFGVLLEILTGSLRIAHRSQDYTEATLWAESLLDQVGVGEPLKEGNESGKFSDDYRWTLDISKIDPPQASMGVERFGAPAGQGRQRGGNGQRPALVQPTTATQAGVEQDTGIDLYELKLTVLWGRAGHEHKAVYTTLRAIDENQNQLHQFGRRPRGR